VDLFIIGSPISNNWCSCLEVLNLLIRHTHMTCDSWLFPFISIVRHRHFCITIGRGRGIIEIYAIPRFYVKCGLIRTRFLSLPFLKLMIHIFICNLNVTRLHSYYRVGADNVTTDYSITFNKYLPTINHASINC